jgi:hypothetical protein
MTVMSLDSKPQTPNHHKPQNINPKPKSQTPGPQPPTPNLRPPTQPPTPDPRPPTRWKQAFVHLNLQYLEKTPPKTLAYWETRNSFARADVTITNPEVIPTPEPKP